MELSQMHSVARLSLLCCNCLSSAGSALVKSAIWKRVPGRAIRHHVQHTGFAVAAAGGPPSAATADMSLTVCRFGFVWSLALRVGMTILRHN